MEAESKNGLSENVNRVLNQFVTAARDSFSDDLRAVVLFGSAAEGKLRPTSDVNLLLVLSQFNQARADNLREPLRTAEAAIQLRVMFLLESEITTAVKAFAVKFGDILRRHRVLHGEDPFAGISISRADSISRLMQTLLNLTLRMRETYVARGLREEQLTRAIAEIAGPLRSCAATLLELEGKPANSPKEALQTVAASLPNADISPEVISQISEARERRVLQPGTAGQTFLHLIDLAHSMWQRALTLS